MLRAPRLMVAGLTMVATATATAVEAHAQQGFSFTLSGPGISGSVLLTYGPTRDAKYANAYEVTGISGTFTDRNNGLTIVNAPIVRLVPITRATPDSTNLLAPRDFSRYPVATGTRDGSLSYDNLLWPGGSPQTASDYPPAGGFLDIYGLMFDIGGGRVVNVWSDGDDGTGLTYGTAVTTSAAPLDYMFAGVTVTATPEPGAVWLLGVGAVGVAGVMARRRRPSLDVYQG